MDFQSLPKIENPSFYLDVAFKASNDKKITFTSKSSLMRAKELETEKIDTAGKTIFRALNKIVTEFPKYRNLPEFYQELMKCYLDPKEMENSINSITWSAKKVNEFTAIYKDKMTKMRQLGGAIVTKREFYGRVSSLVKKLQKDLMYLENIRKLLKSMPTIKSEVSTVCIIGFPNVGKTTLLTKLTPSKAEIASYSFTTKGLNVGYMSYNTKNIQIIDTPGTLNRPEKMNLIEKQAYLAIRYLADQIVYVFDLTEGYPIKDQIKLYKTLKKEKKPIAIYFSKIDLLEGHEFDEFIEKNKTVKEYYTDFESLKESLLKKF